MYGVRVHNRLGVIGNFTEGDVIDLVKQLLYAVNYLHSIKNIHMNLKSGNFIYSNENDNLLKLIDF